MLGTLIAALEVRGIPVGADGVSAEVAGENELEDGIPVLRRVKITYRLALPAGHEEKLQRALQTHAAKCPTARSLRGAVEVTWSVG